MGRSTPTTAFEGAIDALPSQCRHIEHMHEGFLLFLTNNDTYKNFFSLICFFYICIDSALMCRSTPNIAFANFISNTLLT